MMPRPAGNELVPRCPALRRNPLSNPRTDRRNRSRMGFGPCWQVLRGGRVVRCLEIWAARLRRDVRTLRFALWHPATPWYAKLLAAAVAAYALSPIDLIPDFIPILGLVDDLVVVPLGVWLLLRILPASVLSESRAAAEQSAAHGSGKPYSLGGLVMVLAVWGVLLGGLASYFAG